MWKTSDHLLEKVENVPLLILIKFEIICWIVFCKHLKYIDLSVLKYFLNNDSTILTIRFKSGFLSSVYFHYKA